MELHTCIFECYVHQVINDYSVVVVVWLKMNIFYRRGGHDI